MHLGVALAFGSSSSTVSPGLPGSTGLHVLLIAGAVLVAVVGVVLRVRNVRRYSRVSSWKKLLLWDTSPWTYTGRLVRRSAAAEQARAEREAVFMQTEIALAQQNSQADPAARYGMATIPEHAPAEAFPPTPATPSTPFPPPRPVPSAPTADDVLPKQH